MNEDQERSTAARIQAMLSVISPWWQRIRDWIGPWVRRLCQNTEQRDQARRERIAAWRAAVDRDDFEHRQFADSDAYATLRSHLPEDLQQEIDRWRNPYMVVVPARGGRDLGQARLLQEIARVERDWGLI
jgi:hypothetical protein